VNSNYKFKTVGITYSMTLQIGFFVLLGEGNYIRFDIIYI
jgi:hypothetical protein